MGSPWDGTRINCYGMGMGQINMSHGHYRVGQKRKFFLKLKKRGFLNSGKSAKNVLNRFRWLTVTTALQPRDKGLEKVKFNKIDITFDTLRLQSSFWSQNAQKYQNYIYFLRTFFCKPNSVCG